MSYCERCWGVGYCPVHTPPLPKKDKKWPAPKKDQKDQATNTGADAQEAATTDQDPVHTPNKKPTEQNEEKPK